MGVGDERAAKLKRYGLEWFSSAYLQSQSMCQRDDGEWVRYDDILADRRDLLAENERLKSVIEAARRQTKHFIECEEDTYDPAAAMNILNILEEKAVKRES